MEASNTQRPRVAPDVMNLFEHLGQEIHVLKTLG